MKSEKSSNASSKEFHNTSSPLGKNTQQVTENTNYLAIPAEVLFCETCRKKTRHSEHGFKGYNYRLRCLECKSVNYVDDGGAF